MTVSAHSVLQWFNKFSTKNEQQPCDNKSRKKNNPNGPNTKILSVSFLYVCVCSYICISIIWVERPGWVLSRKLIDKRIVIKKKKTQTILSIHNIITQIENMLQLFARFYDFYLFVFISMPQNSCKVTSVVCWIHGLMLISDIWDVAFSEYPGQTGCKVSAKATPSLVGTASH